VQEEDDDEWWYEQLVSIPVNREAGDTNFESEMYLMMSIFQQLGMIPTRVRMKMLQLRNIRWHVTLTMLSHPVPLMMVNHPVQQRLKRMMVNQLAQGQGGGQAECALHKIALHIM
jgi:hypothetical protein